MARRSHRCGDSIICRVFTISVIAAGVVISCLAIRNCDFLKTSAGNSIGLFAYSNSNEQCTMYNGAIPYGWLQAWARYCAIIAPALAAVVILMIIVEFCCDICCWTLFRSVLLSFAEISQASTFVIYGSSACASDIFNEDFKHLMLGGCNFSQGSLFSAIALGLYFIGGIFLCFTPRQKPLCKKDEEEAEPAAAAETMTTEKKEEEEKPSDVEAGVVGEDEGVKAQVY